MATKVLQILTMAHMRTTERFVADADPQNILESPIDAVLVYYFYLLHFHYLWYNIDEAKTAGWIKRDNYDIRLRMTVEHGTIHCRRGPTR